MRSAALLLAVVAACASCTGGKENNGDGRDCSGPPPPVSGFSGGATPIPTIEVAVRSSNGEIVVPAAGDKVPIVFAPQGGFIVLAGVRTQGFEPCIELTAAIRDPLAGNSVVTLEMRPARLEDGGDGWLYPHRPGELYNWANLTACQTGIATRDFHGEPYLFEMFADDGWSTSAVTRELVPWCAFEDALCEEQCTTLDTSMAFSR